MIFIINDQKQELNNPSVQQIMEKINQRLDANTYYSHLVVDGKAVYDDCGTYLKEHLSDINELEVVTQSIEVLIYSNLNTAKQYLDRALPAIPQLSDDFYQSPSAEDWQMFNDLLQGMEWLGKLAAAIGQNSSRPNQWGQYLLAFSPIQENLSELETAVKEKDTVLIGDLIQYELLPHLSVLNGEIGKTIDKEEKHYDLN